MIARTFERLSEGEYCDLATLSEDLYHCDLRQLDGRLLSEPSFKLSCSYVVPEHTQTTLMITAASEKSVLNWDLKIHLQPHAHCSVQWIDREKTLQTLNLTAHISLEEKSSFKSFILFNPSADRVMNEHYSLKEKSSLEIFALIFQTQDVLFHYAPVVRHEEKQTHTDIKVRTLLAAHSDTVLSGRLTLLPYASAQAHYHNHNLIVQGSPKLSAQPELEIDFDQVQCTHGVTLGQLDREALFYMQARGLSAFEAKTLLMRSFIFKDPHPLLTQYQVVLDTLLNTLF